MRRLRQKGGWVIAIRRSTHLMVAGWLLGLSGLHRGAQQYCFTWALVFVCPHDLRSSVQQHRFRSGLRRPPFFAETLVPSEADDSPPVAFSGCDDLVALLAAATTFREEYRSSLIDPGFRVPDKAPWPEVLRGVDLGERIANAKNNAEWVKVQHPIEYQMLIDLGFIQEQNENNNIEEEMEEKMGEEEAVKGMTGEISEETKNSKSAAATAASIFVPTSVLGSTYRTSGGNKNEMEWKAIVESLRAYRSIKHTMHVPGRFVIPSEAPWPRETWGHKLGARVASIRNQESYVKKHPARRRTLDEMGFHWKVKRTKNKEPSLRQDLKYTPLRVGSQGAQPVTRSATPQAAEEEEYQMFFEALKGYKQVHRDVMVPFKWKVPHSSLWPEVMHGYELGEVCTAVRSEGRFSINVRPERQQDLTVLGFEWDIRNQATDTKFKKICDALTCYRALYGDINVPQGYVIPSSPDDPETKLWPKQHHGMKLGIRVHSIRTLKTYIRGSALRKYQLDDLGFVWGLDKVLPKNTVRKPIPGATLPIRRPYMVEDDNDDGMEGGCVDLSTVFNFSSLPFIFRGEPISGSSALVTGTSTDAEMEGNNERMQRTTSGGLIEYSLMDGFRESSSSHGEQDGTMKFGYSILPHNDAIAPPRPGLAVFLSNKDRINRLLNNPRKKLERLLEKYHEESLIEKAVHPETKRVMWPEENGLREAMGHLKYLGPLAMGREGHDGLNHQLHTKPPLKIAGSYSSGSELEMSPMMNGDLVMRDDGMLLRAGASSKAIPRGMDMTTLDWMTDTDRAAINKQGFVWDEFGGGYTFDQVVEALLFYQKMYGDLDVSVGYTTPYDYEWPRLLSNIKLGIICQAMRCGDIDAYEDPERRARLDEIGFDWGNQENFLHFQYDEFIIAMFAHQSIRGDCAVEADFAIPDEDPWPLPLRGMPLGYITNMVRHQEQILKKYYVDRWTLLNGMEFVWCEPEWEEWEDVEVNGIGNGAPLKPPQLPVSQILVKRGMDLYSMDPEEARVYMTKRIEQPDMTDPVPLKNIRHVH